MGLDTARILSIAVLAITLLLGGQVQFIFDNMVAIIEEIGGRRGGRSG